MLPVIETPHAYVSKRHCAICSRSYGRTRPHQVIPVIPDSHPYASKYHCRTCNQKYQKSRYQPVPLSRDYVPISNPHRERLAWAAGFYDGEGNFWVSEDGSAIRLTIHQADPRPLRRFHDAVLGFGSVNGPYSRAHRVHRENHSAMWTWCAQNYEDVQYVIGWLWEFLSEPKREQIEHYMKVYAARSHKTRLPRRTSA